MESSPERYGYHIGHMDLYSSGGILLALPLPCLGGHSIQRLLRNRNSNAAHCGLWRIHIGGYCAKGSDYLDPDDWSRSQRFCHTHLTQKVRNDYQLEQ